MASRPILCAPVRQEAVVAPSRRSSPRARLLRRRLARRRAPVRAQGNKGIELKMRLQYKIMRKLNLTSWLVVFGLASLATPLMAQQVPATPEAVRKALNPATPAKPAAAANAPSAATPSPKQAQTPKPAPSTNSAAKPAASATIPATGSSPSSSSPSKPAANATTIGTAKPAGKSVEKPASGGTVASKRAPGRIGATTRPTPGLRSNSPSSVVPNSSEKPPKTDAVTAAKSDVSSS